MALADEIHIRAANDADVEAIAAVHFSAVHQLASDSYPAAALDLWSPAPNEARLEQFRQAIRAGREILYLAECGGRVVGFGALVPELQELRALYVHATASGCGVGVALLMHLQAAASEHGCEQLHLSASLNSESFYRRNGYQVIEHSTHRLENGHEMACVKMSKRLDPRCTAA